MTIQKDRLFADEKNVCGYRTAGVLIKNKIYNISENIEHFISYDN